MGIYVSKHYCTAFLAQIFLVLMTFEMWSTMNVYLPNNFNLENKCKL